ncbi:hypothetical protein [Paenisporosarcina antarctica]|uniref:Uncharacterized protein n=1 Tax=Paenisporosarcina antarctica TaxID=417367 RepID=A0A4P6ZUB0_9BACL|nr:hypothetical protein [Paenisporosarcina antarctica]QBP39674.1 hypothetical protein E2636_00215 [Paenisporosarcina antarctica]
MKFITNKIIILVISVVIFIGFFQLFGFFSNLYMPSSSLGSMISMTILFILIPLSYLSAYGVVKIIKAM